LLRLRPLLLLLRAPTEPVLAGLRVWPGTVATADTRTVVRDALAHGWPAWSTRGSTDAGEVAAGGMHGRLLLRAALGTKLVMTKYCTMA